VAAGLVIDAQLTVGRLVLHSFPIYLPLLALAFDASMRTSGDGDVRPG
jgi:hypothetical protein